MLHPSRTKDKRLSTDRSLPTGTITFLFTDIEGSTRLVQHLGEGYYALLERHQAILRSAWANHGGVEVLTEGDSFFVVFRSAPEAVAAAVEGQRALEAEPWPDDARVRVRMGLHTGEGSSAPARTSASTSTVLPGSPPQVTAVRSSSRRARGRSFRPTGSRSVISGATA